MKKLLLLFALVAITASAAAQFKKAGSMEVIKRYGNGIVVLSKHQTNSDESAIYYITLKAATHNYAFYLDPVKLGNKEQAILFFTNMYRGWDDMRNGDEFSDLGLPDGQSGFCRLELGLTKTFCIICNSLGDFGVIYKSMILRIIDAIENDQ